MLQGPQILTIYDIRGIQSFIYRTNRIQDVVGGSRIVGTILEVAYQDWCDKKKEPNRYLHSWYEVKSDDISHSEQTQQVKPFSLLGDSTIQSEVLCFGGGNLTVMYRDNTLAQEAGAHIARYIVNNAYSLNVVHASVEVGTDFSADRKKLLSRLDRVRLACAPQRPAGGFPFTVSEVTSGLPVVDEVIYRKKNEPEEPPVRVSTETLKKHDAYQEIKNDADIKKYCSEIDDMILETKGNSNMIAVIHFDGNDMSTRIDALLGRYQDYSQGIQAMRIMSLHIINVFENIVPAEMEAAVRKQPNIEELLPMRPIIQAGDDLTIICRANLAFLIAQKALETIRKYRLMPLPYGEGQDYLSACAGIAFVHSHFPFSKAYEMAEMLCSSAKKRAKSKDGLENGKVGSFLDYQVFYSGMIHDLESLRNNQYRNTEGKQLWLRPYRVGTDTASDPYSIESLTQKVIHLRSSHCPRSWVKKAQIAYHATTTDVEKVFMEVASREGRCLTLEEGEHSFARKDDKGYPKAQYYDAMEIMDIWADEEGRE